MFTEAQLKRVLEIRRAVYSDADLKAAGIKREDIALLVARIDDLTEPDRMLGADALMQWVRKRLEEDLNEKREWLAEAIEQIRVAELQVKEAEHALAAVADLVDGGIYASAAEIIERWDAMEALYASRGMIPAPEAQEQSDNPAPDEPVAALPEPEPEPEPPAREVFFDAERSERGIESLKQYRWEGTEPGPVEPGPAPPAREMDFTEPKWSDEDVARMKARGPAPELSINRIPEAPQPASLGAEQEVAILAALNDAAHGAAQVQIALKQLSDASRVPQGSCLPVLRRLADAGQIEIIKAPPKGKVQQPNFYRFVNAPRPAEHALADATALPAEPVPAQDVAGKLAEAWGGRVKPPKSTGSVSASAPLRERVLGMLGKAACTTSGLASMLDVKELAVCQTLEAMRHEGSVVADEMPEAGRRAQLWRPSPQP